MSKSKTTTMATLLRKREQLEQQILAAQAEEKRTAEILSMLQFRAILHLPEDVLRDGFVRIARENPSS